MNIKPVNFNKYCYENYNKQNPSFTSIGPIFKDYRDVNGVLRSTQITTDFILREDLNYKSLAKTIHKEINPLVSKNILQKIARYLKIIPTEPWRKAKIYSMAGADGSEAYAIADAIIGEIGFEKAKKYVFPIYVSDVDKWVIDTYGKSGQIDIFDEEIEKLPNIKTFLTKIGSDKTYKKSTYSIKPEFRECFEFEVADLQAKINDLPDPEENEFNVFIIRNCLVQAFNIFERDAILNQLTTKYPQDAIVVLGGYDLKHMTETKFIPFDPINVGLQSIGNNTFRSCKYLLDKIESLKKSLNI